MILAVVLICNCVTCINSQLVPAVTNSRTTLLDGYGPTSNVLTTLERGASFVVNCRVSDAFVYDDPWWLNVTVDGVGIGSGWVADYYADCGYIGYCEVVSCF